MGRDLEGITGLEYNDEQELENIYGVGKFPIGQGEGNYTAQCKLTVLNEERLLLLAALPKGTRLQDLSFSAIVAYEYKNIIYTDIIHNCRFKNNGVKASQNDKSLSHDFDLLITHIDWNV